MVDRHLGYTGEQEQAARRERLLTNLSHIEAKLNRGTNCIKAGHQLKDDYPAREARERPLSDEHRGALEFNLVLIKSALESWSFRKTLSAMPKPLPKIAQGTVYNSYLP
jgi:hypothetical protein